MINALNSTSSQSSSPNISTNAGLSLDTILFTARVTVVVSRRDKSNLSRQSASLPRHPSSRSYTSALRSRLSRCARVSSASRSLNTGSDVTKNPYRSSASPYLGSRPLVVVVESATPSPRSAASAPARRRPDPKSLSRAARSASLVGASTLHASASRRIARDEIARSAAFALDVARCGCRSHVTARAASASASALEATRSAVARHRVRARRRRRASAGIVVTARRRVARRLQIDVHGL